MKIPASGPGKASGSSKRIIGRRSTGDRGRGPGRRGRIPDRRGGAEEETPRVRDPTSPGTVSRESDSEETNPTGVPRAAEPFPPRVAGWMESLIHGCEPSPVRLSAPNRLDWRPQTLRKAVRLRLMSSCLSGPKNHLLVRRDGVTRAAGIPAPRLPE